MKYIYCLLDNEQRYEEHLRSAINPCCSRSHYIKYLLDKGHQIGIAILFKCNKSDAGEYERKYIKTYLEAGAALINKYGTPKRRIPKKWRK